jgi:hypothetical protein
MQIWLPGVESADYGAPRLWPITRGEDFNLMCPALNNVNPNELNNNGNRVVRVSYDKCDVPGLYWSSGCEHADYQDMKLNDIFPVCQTCQKAIIWIHDRPITK